MSVPTLIFGKLAHGITATVVHMAACKMLNETVPVYYLGYFGIFIQAGLSGGYALCFGLGNWLP